MSPTPRFLPAKSRRRGIALVVTLAIIVLVTIAVVAFFSRATSNRGVEASRMNQVLAEQIARTAGDYILGQFLEEIRDPANSTIFEGDITIYQPKEAKNIVPDRTKIPSFASVGSGFENLIRQSTPASDPNASADPTTGASRNSRVINAPRWDAPRLTVANFGAAQVPNWIYLQRDGTTSDTPNPAGGNNPTIGRFAYNAYDVGGLLDVNVAGAASSVSASERAFKGSLGLADLAAIPGVTNPAQFADAWRNLATGTTTADYLAYLGLSASPSTSVTNRYYNLGPQTGFLRAVGGDNRILGRRDLIKFAQNGGFGIDPAALPYLTHFTRELNAPSWGPTRNASEIGGNDQGGVYAYKDNANNLSALNRFVPQVRVKTGFLRPDNTNAQVGEPLLKTRFPLSRLGGLSYQGIAAVANSTLLNGSAAPASTATILRDFGLTWDDSSRTWTYSQQDANGNIKTLEQVANENPGREPNFFELLQAGMLSGSLGKDSIESSEFTTISTGSAYYQGKTTLQILRIGAAIIDQYDSDSYPTVIKFTTPVGIWEAVGTERLPYIAQYMPIFGGSPNPPPGMANPTAGYMLVNLWDPHQNTSFSGGARPDVRIVVQGKGTRDFRSSAPDMFSIPAPGLSLQLTGAARDAAFVNGTIVSATHAVTVPGMGPNNTPAWAAVPTLNYAGLRMPDFTHDFTKDGAAKMVYSWPFASGDGFQISMEYYNGSSWRAYNYAHGINDTQTWQGYRQYNTWMLSPSATYFWDAVNYDRKTAKADPRSLRFSGGQYDWVSPGGSFRTSLWAETNTPSGQVGQQKFPAAMTGGRFFGALARNTTASPAYYRDNDEVTRIGDSGLFNGNGASGNPYANGSDRSFILDRPFANVAELGYVFRDQPFKTLDFFSANSADSGLLDLFSVNEAPSRLRAGVVNLNTRQATVLQAILSGASRSGANTITSDIADSIADAIVAQSNSEPFTNIADLPELVANNAKLGNLKYEREAIARALSGVTQTRTWNFLIDVIAQTGKTNAGSPEFLVESEQRYWLHVALDRITGKVVDQQWEAINE